MSAADQPKNIPASVRARLANVARKRDVEFQLVLSEFANERLLYRLGVSPHADEFLLKGAMLFKLWASGPTRATWDLDLLGRGLGSISEVEIAIRDICTIEADDGIVFDPASVEGEQIRPADEYAGVRVKLEARLAEARIPLQVDVGFGDAIVPPPTRASYPTLLDHEAPHVLAYPREAVIAEKLEAMVTLGVTNSRMKDFYDLYVLASSFAFDGDLLAQSVRSTFTRRGTPLPRVEPVALTREYLAAPERTIQWRAFLRRARLDGPADVGSLGDALRQFLVPVIAAAAKGDTFSQGWEPGGPWVAGG